MSSYSCFVRIINDTGLFHTVKIAVYLINNRQLIYDNKCTALQ